VKTGLQSATHDWAKPKKGGDMTQKNQMKDKPQIQVKHPPEYQNDLNPGQVTSQNLGQYSVGGDLHARTAADFKELVRMFHDRFTMDELRQMPIVPAGTQLKQNAAYLDLAARESGAFMVRGPVVAREDRFLIPKHEVPYELWNRLLEIEH
jgi:hypothetical protein